MSTPTQNLPNQTSLPSTNPNSNPNQDPFGGLDVVSASDIKGTEHLKAAILGKPKSGKSWFAVTAPGNTLVYDFDDRWLSLQGKGTNIKIEKSLRDTTDKPWVWDKLEKDLGTLKYRKLKGLPVPDNYVFDSVTHLLTAIKHRYLQDNPKDGRRLKLGNNMVQIGVSYDLINIQNRSIEYLVTEYSQLGNVIFVFHERDEKDKAESTADRTVYTGFVTVEPQYIANILTIFNEVFRIQVIGGVGGRESTYQVTCRPDNEMIASTTLLLDSKEIPNLEEMIKKHKERKAAKK